MIKVQRCEPLFQGPLQDLKYGAILGCLEWMLALWAAVAVVAEGQTVAKEGLKLEDALSIQATSGDFSSTGKAVVGDWAVFWSNATGEIHVECDADLLVRVAVEAYGTPAEGWGPEMQLDLDRMPRFLWHITAVRAKPAWYVSPPLAVKPGKHVIRLSFTNDYYRESAMEDRNLFLRRILIAPVRQVSDLPRLDGKELAASGISVVETGTTPKASVTEPLPPYTSSVIPITELKPVKLPEGGWVRPGEFHRTWNLAGHWKLSPLLSQPKPFEPDADEETRFSAPSFDDSSWEDFPIPLNWYARHPELYPKSDAKEARPYVKGWYRARLKAPVALGSNRVLLQFQEIGYEATLWVNGRRIGSHEGDFTPAIFDITDALDGRGEGTLAMRVLSDFGPNWGVPKAKHVYGSQWGPNNIKAGIWGEATLNMVSTISIARALVTPRLARSAIEVDLHIVNASKQEVLCSPEILVQSAMRSGRHGRESRARGPMLVASPGMTETRLLLPLKSPQTWSPSDPHLYYAHVALTAGKQVIDFRTERFGFREFKVRGRHFYLNGKRIYLFGENLPSVWFGGSGEDQRDFAGHTLKRFRDAGYVILRTPHHPIIPQVVDLADEIGIMIFDEWGWSFTSKLDTEQFEQQNLRDVEAWVRRDYNHPSVVMWSGGNEVHYDDPFVAEQFNKQAALIRRLDPSGRPVSVFDGAAVGYGEKPLDTDVYCYHDYLGLAARPWSFLPDQVARNLERIRQKFGDEDKPVIVWECVGFSWGPAPQKRRAGQPIPVDTYLDWCRRPTQWARPDLPAGVGLMGLRTWMDPDWGLRWGQEVMGKRILETLRITEGPIQGWAPWFHNPYNIHAPIWNAPLQTFAADLTRHPHVGGILRAILQVVNDQDAAADRPIVIVRLVRLLAEEGAFRPAGYREPEEGEEVLDQRRVKLTSLAPFEHRQLFLDWPIPAAASPGDYRLLLTTRARVAGQIQEAHNYYELAIGSVPAPFREIGRKVALLNHPQSAASLTGQVLNDLALHHTALTTLTEINSYDVLILPARATDQDCAGGDGADRVASWVKNGGVLLILEQQKPGPVPFFSFYKIVGRNPNTLVDMVVPEHPAFSGLKQRHLDAWDGGDHQMIVRYSIGPLQENVIAAAGHLLGGSGVTAALVDARIGKGRLILSQLEAVDRWKKDSCATRYLANLLRETLANEAWPGVRELVPKRLMPPDAGSFFEVDLKPYANRPLRDKVAEDGQGGWTDQGELDLRNLPSGRQEFLGVPFEIIAAGNAALLLRGQQRPDFPARVDGIQIGRKASELIFLHTVAWAHHGLPGRYVIHFVDGQTLEVPLKIGENVGDWWQATDLPQASLGWDASHNIAGWIGLHLFVWNNPRREAEIASLDFVSGGGAVPALLAITGVESKSTGQ